MGFNIPLVNIKYIKHFVVYVKGIKKIVIIYTYVRISAWGRELDHFPS